MNCNMDKSRRVLILAYTKLGMIAFFSVLFVILCILFGVYFKEIEAKVENANEYIITVVIVYLVMMAFETSLLVLLFMAIKQRSFKKCRIWFVLNGIVFAVSVISFLVEAFAGWPKSFVGTMFEMLYDGIALKIVYDFMMEVRVTPDGDVPFEEMKSEAV